MLDPYRILGVQPGASQAEIKRAYRLLVKAYHPDSAGPGEIQHFLAIQRAYEALKNPTARRLPRSSRPSPATPPTPAASPWEADPDRARATRERAGARRPGAGRTGARTGSPGGRTGADARSGSEGGRSRTAGSGGSAGDAAGETGREDATSSRPRGRRKSTRKATFGSTTYDEAREQVDSTWAGASWYGPSSGEYWTVNPREYADPRKHGPEYLARARRPLGRPGADGGPIDDDGTTTDDRPTGDDARGADGGSPARGSDRSRAWPPTPERGQWSTVSAGPDSAWGRAGSEPGGSRHQVPTPARPGTSVSWVDRIPADARDPLHRLVLALIAWPPLGIVAATIAGAATGCLDASATCTDATELLPWLLQAGILGILVAAPPLAAILAAGTVFAAVAAIPITAVLVAIGANYDTVRGPMALAILLAAAWVGGVAFAAARRVRRMRRGDRPAGRAPVS